MKKHIAFLTLAFSLFLGASALRPNRQLISIRRNAIIHIIPVMSGNTVVSYRASIDACSASTSNKEPPDCTTVEVAIPGARTANMTQIVNGVMQLAADARDLDTEVIP